MALPVAQALKTKTPCSSIEFLCSKNTGSLIELSPHINQVYTLHHRNIPYRFSREKQKLARQLSEQKYSQIFLMESSPRFLKVLSKSDLTKINSYVEFPFDSQLHSIENNLRLAGLKTNLMASLEIDLNLATSCCYGLEEHIQGLKKPLVGIHPGYGPPRKKPDQTSKLKGWPRSSFIKVSRALQNMGASILITGSKHDLPDANYIANSLQPRQTRILTGKTTLPQLARLLSHLDLLISVDSGPAHLCAAVKTPLIVLWGPAKWIETRPISCGATVMILRTHLPCSPCYDQPPMKTCLRNTCMELIRPEEVFSTSQKILNLP